MSSQIPDGFDLDLNGLCEMVVRNDLRSAKLPEDTILAELNRHGYSEDTVFAVKLALEEAMTNAVKHGNKCDPTKRITVRYHIAPQRVIIMVRDEGCGFHPDTVPDPTAAENIERPNGRGIMLIHSYMTKVYYSPSGNEVWMLKLRDEPRN
ncbi:MAG: Serine-protein kinase RsbW [Phycisphaerae bacterium]|nr:Serine-protein kinase RsbW [Phycisphaerae bacterium]